MNLADGHIVGRAELMSLGTPSRKVCDVPFLLRY
jgi:hypothetical protein